MDTDRVGFFSEYLRYKSTFVYESAENQQRKAELSVMDLRHRTLQVSDGELQFQHLENCRYCRLPLGEDKRKTINPKSVLHRKSGCFQVCSNCGWWQGVEDWNHVSETHSSRTRKITTTYEAIVKSFDIKSTEVPNDALRVYLAKNPARLSDLDPRKFEILLQSVYRDFFDCEVLHVGGPGDGGIDLYVVNSEDPFIVQAKRRSNLESTESVATVREFLGAMIENGAFNGHIVTTAQKFSKPAKKLASNSRLERFDINLELIAFQNLLSMINVANAAISHPSDTFVRRLY